MWVTMKRTKKVKKNLVKVLQQHPNYVNPKSEKTNLAIDLVYILWIFHLLYFVVLIAGFTGFSLLQYIIVTRSDATYEAYRNDPGFNRYNMAPISKPETPEEMKKEVKSSLKKSLIKLSYNGVASFIVFIWLIRKKSGVPP